jgi:hypothetical protein
MLVAIPTDVVSSNVEHSHAAKTHTYTPLVMMMVEQDARGRFYQCHMKMFFWKLALACMHCYMAAMLQCYIVVNKKFLGHLIIHKESRSQRERDCVASEEDFTLVVSLNEYILRGDAVGTSCTYVDSRV